MISREVQDKLIRAVAACPDGLQRMSPAMPGLVQTSTNLARVVSDGRSVQLQCLLRSSVNSEKEALGDAIAAVFELAGAKVELTGSYDGWNPDMDSPDPQSDDRLLRGALRQPAGRHGDPCGGWSAA